MDIEVGSSKEEQKSEAKDTSDDEEDDSDKVVAASEPKDGDKNIEKYSGRNNQDSDDEIDFGETENRKSAPTKSKTKLVIDDDSDDE